MSTTVHELTDEGRRYLTERFPEFYEKNGLRKGARRYSTYTGHVEPTLDGEGDFTVPIIRETEILRKGIVVDCKIKRDKVRIPGEWVRSYDLPDGPPSALMTKLQFGG